MPTRRMIDPAIWQSESVARLTYRQRLLFIGLFSNADDQGRLRGHPSLIRSTVFPYDDIPIEEIEADLSAIAAADSIFIYQAEGTRYIQITNWWQYQTPQWAYPSRICAPEGWQDKLRYRQNNEVHTENWDDQGGFVKGQTQNNGGNSENGVGQSLSEIGKDLAEPLPKDLGEAIELVVESEIDPTTTTNTRARKETFAQICQTYENEIGLLSPMVRDMIADDSETYPADWIIQAIQIAVKRQKRNWGYIEGILKQWRSIGGPQNDKPPERKVRQDAAHQGHNSRFGTGHDPTLNKTTNPYTGETVYLS